MNRLEKSIEVIRHICLRIVTFVWFERFIFLSIIISSLFLAFSDYNCVDNDNNLIAQCSVRNTILINSEIIFVIIFTTELLLKIIAFGMFYSPYKDEFNEYDESVLKSMITKGKFSAENIKRFPYSSSWILCQAHKKHQLKNKFPF